MGRKCPPIVLWLKLTDVLTALTVVLTIFGLFSFFMYEFILVVLKSIISIYHAEEEKPMER